MKGKSEPVDVFTFEEDDSIRDLTIRGLEAFAKRDWDGTQQAFEAILAQRPEDLVSKRYLGRIAVLRSEPPGDDWTPAEALDKM